jgi:hypothetical protein
MPVIRANTAVDPQQISSSFDNIAAMFKPPTATEILAGAKAAETRQKVGAIAELLARGVARTPEEQQLIDQRAGLVGAYNPNASLTAVDRNNLTSRQNNAADNSRALTLGRESNETDITKALLAPVGANDTRFIPPAQQQARGLPAQQVGIVKLGQGDTATLPNGGGTIAGAVKPMTLDERKGEAFSRLPASQQEDAAFGNTPVETIIRNGMPEIASRRQAIGQTPQADATKVQVTDYELPDGSGAGTARLENGKWVDTQTGAELPQGIRTFKSQVQGGKDDVLGTTLKNASAQKLADIAQAKSTIQQYRDLIKKNPGAIGPVGTVRGIGQDLVASAGEASKLFSPKVQQFEQDILKGRVDPEIVDQFRSFGKYDPAIPNAKLLELVIAAQAAKSLDPNGRVSNERMKQLQTGLGGGGLLANGPRTLANLDALESMLDDQTRILTPTAPGAAAVLSGQPLPGRQGRALATANAPAPAPAAPAATGGAFVRGPDGKIVRAQ